MLGDAEATEANHYDRYSVYLLYWYKRTNADATRMYHSFDGWVLVEDISVFKVTHQVPPPTHTLPEPRV